MLGSMEARRAILCEQLESEAGNHPLEDRYKVGYLACIRDLLNVEIEEIETDD